MNHLSPEMIRVMQYEQERRASQIQLENVAKAARRESESTEGLTLLAKVLGYLSLNTKTSLQE
jgi:hypothetical protein